MTDLVVRAVLLVPLLVMGLVVGRRTLRRTGGKYPLIRGQGSWHQPPGWWWDQHGAQWRPEGVPRPEVPTADDVEAEQSQGFGTRPEWMGNWERYQAYIRALPAWRPLTTVAMVVVGDAGVLVWPDLAYRGVFISIAVVITACAFVPLVARYRPSSKG